MKLTRDSAVLWIGAAVAVLGYLSVSASPATWVYADWIKFAMFVLVWASGKLARSPLKGERDF